MLELIVFTDASYKRDKEEGVSATYAYSYQLRDTYKNLSELTKEDKKITKKGGISNEKCVVKVELQAVKETLKAIKNSVGLIAERILIHTDSRILIQSQEIDNELIELMDFYKNKKIKVEFFKVKAHTDNVMNERVDRYAKYIRKNK